MEPRGRADPRKINEIDKDLVVHALYNTLRRNSEHFKLQSGA